ncbi:MAG: metallophosphoesterase [Muribaculaceae bacterium]|nr:metallophosphoesterase [Muribaculaceae bacterium]
MILVIPDVHGRNFWREPCQHLDRYSHVVFLGDYLDPYGFDGVNPPDAFEGLKDIIALGEANPDKVTLLLGNHDLHYITGAAGRSSRYNRWFAEQAGPVLTEHRSLFKLAYELNGTLFTHAGCLQAWLDEMHERHPELLVEMNAASINTLLDSLLGLSTMAMVSERRGGWNRHGSCVWADVSEHLDVTSPVPQVFGHTLQALRNVDTGVREYRGEVVRPEQRWMMLDCARAFELDDNDPFNYTRIPNPDIDKP